MLILDVHFSTLTFCVIHPDIYRKKLLENAGYPICDDDDDDDDDDDYDDVCPDNLGPAFKIYHPHTVFFVRGSGYVG